MKGKLTCERVLKVRKMNKFETQQDNEAKEMVIFMNSQLNDYKEKYFLLKDKEIRQYNKAKKNVEKKKRKLAKEKVRQERRLKRRQDKLNSRFKKAAESNPFAVDEESKHIGEQNPETTILSESDTESSHSDSSESEQSSDDEDGLTKPKSMHELRLQEDERQRVKRNKRREKELKKIIQEKEKKRQSKVSSSQENKSAGGGGFIRNSVLVQKTLNFFGRSSKIQQVKVSDSDDEDKEDKQLNSKDIKSDSKPEINDYFVQTAAKKPHSDNNSQKENIFDIANKEIDVEFFHKGQDDREEIKEVDNQIFTYKEKPPKGLPPINKKGKNKSRVPSNGVKKLVAPPKNENRHSVLQKPDLMDLLEI